MCAAAVARTMMTSTLRWTIDCSTDLRRLAVPVREVRLECDRLPVDVAEFAQRAAQMLDISGLGG